MTPREAAELAAIGISNVITRVNLDAGQNMVLRPLTLKVYNGGEETEFDFTDLLKNPTSVD